MIKPGKLMAAFVGFVLVILSPAIGEDWPTYMHDPARSGVSGELLSFPLMPLWTYVPPAEPTPAWPNSPEPDKITFDDATHVAMAGDAIYFGSPVDNGIHALDAATGAPRWTFFTEGPVRLAPTFVPSTGSTSLTAGPPGAASAKPTVAAGRVFAGSDDGAVYCLDAQEGKLAWSMRPIPGATRILGMGRVMSLWPVRTDVLVDGDVAYCGAGIFPLHDTTVVALDAGTGKTIWKRAAPAKGDRTPPAIPQGYLVASSDLLYVSRGRAYQQFVSRKDGSVPALVQGIKGRRGAVGGDYGVLVDDLYFFGTQGFLCGVAPDGTYKNNWAETRQVAASRDRLYRLACQKGKSTSLMAFERKSGESAGGKSKEPAGGKPLWTLAFPDLQTFIVVGAQVIVGGSNEVAAVNSASGKAVWRAPVDGVVKGLAAANGRLVASTGNGRLYCFGRGTTVARARPAATPFPADGASPQARETTALAEAIAKDAGVKRGYGLVIGGDAVRLAYELARRTGLLVHAVEPDAAKAATARAALAAAGAYGTKVVVDVVASGGTNGLPYPPYFANVVVAAGEALGEGTVSAKAVLRALKPCGGVLYANTTAPAEAWAKAGRVSAVTPAGKTGWTKLVRGDLPGAGEWTHQYADAGNTASSDDALVKSPLNVLWYGEPGADKMQDRHSGTAAPLFAAGRVYVQGIRQADKQPLLMCFDAYNGVPYWERAVPGALRLAVVAHCGNLAASKDGLFVAVGDRCLQLDPETGETRRTYPLPALAGGIAGTWAYVAVVGDTLVGSVSPTHQFSREVFAYDIGSGQLKWRYAGGVIRDSTLAVSGGRVFFAEHRGVTTAPRILTYLEYLQQEQSKRRGTPAPAKPKDEGIAGDDSAGAGKTAAAPAPAKETYRRTAVALDLETGRELWAREVDLTNCGIWNGKLCAAAKHDVVVFYGAYNAYGATKGDEEKRRALAISARDGSVLWNKAIGNYVRPVLANDWLVARPGAVQLRTGEPVMSGGGKSKPWGLPRTGACGQMSASANMLFYRIGSIVGVDLTRGAYSVVFQGMRPGCLINIIPAGGLVVVPEASSGCVCAHAALQSTIVFVPQGAK